MYYKRISLEDFRILEALQRGKTLSDALDIGFEKSAILRSSDQPICNRPLDTGWQWDGSARNRSM